MSNRSALLIQTTHVRRGVLKNVHTQFYFSMLIVIMHKMTTAAGLERAAARCGAVALFNHAALSALTFFSSGARALLDAVELFHFHS